MRARATASGGSRSVRLHLGSKRPSTVRARGAGAKVGLQLRLGGSAGEAARTVTPAYRYATLR